MCKGVSTYWEVRKGQESVQLSIDHAVVVGHTPNPPSLEFVAKTSNGGIVGVAEVDVQSVGVRGEVAEDIDGTRIWRGKEARE